MGIEDLKSIRATIELLTDEGCANISQEIQDAIDGAATGTELYVGVGYALGKVAKSQVSEMTKARAAKLRNEIAEFANFTFHEPED